MKIILLIWFTLLGTYGFAQVDSKKTVHFIDSTKSPLNFVADQFNNRIKGLDSCCLFAVGSAKFTVHRNRKVDQIEVSLGVPNYIATTLKEAIMASAGYWTLDRPTKTAVIIIPLIIIPSSLCDRANYKDDSFASTANMMIYEGKYGQVVRRDYYKKATGTEFGLVLSPLLIRGPTNDVYRNRSNESK